MTTFFRYGQAALPTNRKHIGSDPKTERIRQIEKLLAQGMRPKDIADALGITPSTLSGVMRRHGIRRP